MPASPITFPTRAISDFILAPSSSGEPPTASAPVLKNFSSAFAWLIETLDLNLVAGMRRLNGVCTQSFNRAHGRVGHVFRGRYKSIVVDKVSYGLELSRYVVLNPGL